jgi:hypothetical protein
VLVMLLLMDRFQTGRGINQPLVVVVVVAQVMAQVTAGRRESICTTVDRGHATARLAIRATGWGLRNVVAWWLADLNLAGLGK